MKFHLFLSHQRRMSVPKESMGLSIVFWGCSELFLVILRHVDISLQPVLLLHALIWSHFFPDLFHFWILCLDFFNHVAYRLYKLEERAVHIHIEVFHFLQSLDPFGDFHSSHLLHSFFPLQHKFQLLQLEEYSSVIVQLLLEILPALLHQIAFIIVNHQLVINQGKDESKSEAQFLLRWRNILAPPLHESLNYSSTEPFQSFWIGLLYQLFLRWWSRDRYILFQRRSSILLRLTVVSIVQLVNSTLAVLNDFPEMLGIHIDMLPFKPFPALGRAFVAHLSIRRVWFHREPICLFFIIPLCHFCSRHIVLNLQLLLWGY